MRYVHTCYRVLDLERSLDFYTNKLGLELARTERPPLTTQQRDQADADAEAQTVES